MKEWMQARFGGIFKLVVAFQFGKPQNYDKCGPKHARSSAVSVISHTEI